MFTSEFDRIRAVEWQDGHLRLLDQRVLPAHSEYLRIENAAKPTVALLDGLSMGGGTELALACQAIVATPHGSLALPETGIGIYPGMGGMLRLARRIGPELAKYYTFTGTVLSASRTTIGSVRCRSLCALPAC